MSVVDKIQKWIDTKVEGKNEERVLENLLFSLDRLKGGHEKLVVENSIALRLNKLKAEGKETPESKRLEDNIKIVSGFYSPEETSRRVDNVISAL